MKKLALCLFDFHNADLDAAITREMAARPDTYRSKADVFDSMPLGKWTNEVRRIYVAGAVQADRLEAWFKEYEQEGVDTLGGVHLFQNIDAMAVVVENKIKLARQERLSGEHDGDVCAVGMCYATVLHLLRAGDFAVVACRCTV